MDAAVIDDVFPFGDFRLDRCGGGLFRVNTSNRWSSVGLGSRALDVLSVLVHQAGELVDRLAVGVDQGANVNAPSSLRTRQA